MFGAGKGLMAQIQLMNKLMKDENFKKLIAHPKVQELFKDPEIMHALQNKDTSKLMSSPKLAVLKSDPELFEIFSKMDLQKFM